MYTKCVLLGRCKMPDAKKIGQRLMELRGKEDRSTIAKEIRISVSALSNYENGLRIPRDEIKLALAKRYNKTVEEIFFA
jgi:putative transcriptional regulator